MEGENDKTERNRRNKKVQFMIYLRGKGLLKKQPKNPE